MMDNPSHIVPVIVGDAEKCQRGERRCCSSGTASTFSRSTIRPSQKGTERLRITPTPLHSDAQVADLVESLVDVWRALKLPFETAKVIPLRFAAKDSALCVYPQTRKAAE